MKKTENKKQTEKNRKRIVLFKEDDTPVYIIDGEIVCIGFCQCCPACLGGKCIIEKENY